MQYSIIGPMNYITAHGKDGSGGSQVTKKTQGIQKVYEAGHGEDLELCREEWKKVIACPTSTYRDERDVK